LFPPGNEASSPQYVVVNFSPFFAVANPQPIENEDAITYIQTQKTRDLGLIISLLLTRED